MGNISPRMVAIYGLPPLLELLPCPNHKGGFDCSPFCPNCEGDQYA